MAIILVVEDNKALREEIAERLELEGFDTLQASNGQQALLLLDETTVDLVLSDMEMPLLDGLGILKEIRQTRQLSVPVIILSAFNGRHGMQQAMAAGANACLVKPFEFDNLIDLIQHYLAAPHR